VSGADLESRPATGLDDPGRIDELRRTIRRKRSLERFYLDVYARFDAVLARCPAAGEVLELGSGGGFLRERMPGVVTSDVLPYQGVDRCIDATRMDVASASLRMICMLNVFHHIPDVAAFLAEADRCLVPGGRVIIVDQHMGWISRPILRHLHHEPCDPGAREWRFEASGPLSGANGALAWIVFRRDAARLAREFPRLRLDRFEPHSPLRYWLAGGLKSWSLLPGALYGAARAFDGILTSIAPELGSFVDIELVKSS